MNALQRTLAILACLFLVVQTVRHTYFLWLAPRTSILATYDQPLAGDIEAAASLEDLRQRYDPVRKAADRVRSEHKAAKNREPLDEYNEEPFKSERVLREAIMTWEDRSRQIGALRFYWFVGLGFATLGLVCYRRLNRWLGLTLAIIGVSEMVYWTSPELMSLLPGGTREFDRLLANKLAFSLASVVVLAVAIRVLRVFDERPWAIESTSEPRSR